MNRIIARITIILCFLITFVNEAEATHAMGGDIWYECNGGNSYTIFYAFYRDCDGVNAPNTIKVDYSSSCTGASQLTLTQLPGTGQDITPTCDGQPSNCSGGTYPGVQKYVYSVTVNLTPCADWTFSEAICCRNNAITNIANPGSEQMYIQATLDNLNNPCNSSPTFSNDPVPYVCIGQTFCFNHGAIDTDGDSIAFQLVTPFDQNSSTTVNYNAGFTPGQPISSNPLMTFDPSNGNICMTPSSLEVSVTAVVVEHWSNGQLVGTIMRDIQIRVINCNNQIPTTDGIDASTNYTTSACAGSPLVFNTYGDDNDVGNLLTMSWNGGIPGATFTIANNGTTDPVGTFSWSPTLADVSTNPYCFTVTVQDDACPLNGFQTYAYCITVGGATIEAVATGTDPNCSAGCDGEIAASVIGGSPGFSYSLDGVSYSPSNTFTGLCQGPYDVYVRDTNNCTDVTQVQLVDPPPMVINATSSNVSCFGASDAVLNVVASGGAPPYTYFWTGGSTTPNVTNAAAGWYSVSVTDANGCIRIQSVFVTEPPELITTVSSTNTSCAGNDGSITLSTSGGTPPYSYTWSHNPGLNQNNATGLAPGQYTAIVTDANGCTTTTNVTITVTGSVTPGFTYNGNQCRTGNSYVFTNTGSAGVSYSWDFGNGVGVSTAENPTYTYPAGGTYTVQQTVINGLCTASTTMNVVVYYEPVLVYSVNNPLCNGDANGNIDVSVFSGTPNYTYLWSNGASTQDVSGLAAGNYSVTVSDLNGCQDTQAFTLIEPNVLTVSSVHNNSYCQAVCDGNAIATANGGTAPYSFIWNDPSSQANDTAVGLCSGTFTVTATDFNGCTATSSETITNTAPVSLTLAVTNSNCGQADGEITATLTNGTGVPTYTWLPGPVVNPTITAIPAGVYSVSAVDANGCTIDSVISIADNAAPSISITSFSNVLCFSDSTGSATAAAIGGVGGYQYTWLPMGGSNSVASGLPAGNYSVSVEDAAGCIASTTVTLSEPTEIIATLNSVNSNCDLPDGEVNVTVSGGVVAGNYQYSWLDQSSFVGNTDTVSGVPHGMYYLFVTDDNGCVLEDSVLVIDNPILKIQVISSNISCFGDCDGSASAIGASGVPPYSYQWNDPLLPLSASVTNLCSGSYIASVTDAAGCVATDTVIIVEPAPVTIVEDTLIPPTCFGDNDGQSTVHAEGGTPGYTYQWDVNANNQVGTSATSLADGQYVVIATDSNGCTGSKIITVIEPVDIVLNGTTIKAHCNLPDGQAQVSIVSGGVAPISYSWTGSPSTSSIAPNLSPGNYTALVTDTNGCQQSIVLTVGNIPAAVAAISYSDNPNCFGSCDGEATVSVSGTGTPPYSYSWNNTNNDSTATATGLCGAINYVATVTDVNGCVSQASAVVTDPPVLSLSINVTDASCFGECSGELNAIVAGGTPPYTYLWNDPGAQITQMATGLCANTPYEVIVTDANGCQVSLSSSLSQPTLMVLDSTVINSHCGQSDGSACISISGGISPYVTTWDFNGSASLCQNSIPGGTYLVHVADANDCFKTIAVTVTDIQGPTANVVSVTDATCTGYNNGQATVGVTGGAVPFAYLWNANAGSQTTPTASNLQAGSYTVSITDSAGCIASTSVTVSEPPPIDLAGTLVNPLCYGYADGSITMNVIGGTAPYNYSWSHNSSLSSSFASGLTSGTYVVNVTDAHACTELISFQLTDPSPVTTMLTPSDPTCFESCNGSITATSITGFNPFHYTWDDLNQQTGSIASSLCIGTYSVVVTDGHGCLDTVQATLTEPTELVVAINLFGNATCNGICDGFALADIQGGVPPYSYQWSNGDTTQVSQNLCAGNYVVVVTDANSCVSFTEITITQPSPITVSSITTEASCFGTCDGAAEVIVTGGTAPYGYQWNDPNLQTTSAINNICAGTYTIGVTDANNCYYSGSVTIGQPNLLSLVSSSVSANCGQSNGSACVSVIGGVPPYTYYWDDPSNQQSACAFGLSSGTYVATITDGNDCQVDSIVAVNDISGPTIDFIQSTDAICFGGNSGSIQMDVNGGTLPYATFHWINNSTGSQTGPVNNPNLPGIMAGCYTLEVVDAAGCYASRTNCITEPPQLNLTVTNIVDATCNGGCDGMATALSVGGTPPYALLWDNGQTSMLASGLCSGSHTVTITDGNNCQTNSNVFIDQPPQITTTQTGGGTTSCFGDCDGIIQLSTSGGTAPYFYNWLPNVANSSIASGLCEGSYTVQTIDGNGCILNADYIVSSPSVLGGTISRNNATCGDCNGTATLTGTGGTTPYSYQWNNGQTSQTANTLCVGAIEGTIIDNNGCTYTLNTAIIDIPGPVINNIISVNPTCNSSTNGIASVSFTGGTSPFTYNWNLSTLNQATALFLGAGTHCVEIVDANGCTDVRCVELTEPSSVVAVIDGQDSICFGDSVQIWASASGGNGAPYSITWLPPDTAFIGSGPIMVNPDTTTYYCFNASDVTGCLSSDPGCIEVFVHPSLSLSVGNLEFICPGDSITLLTSTSGGSGNPYSFEWYIGSVDSSNSIGNDSAITITSDTSITYYITLDDGCSLPNIDSVQLVVNPNPTASIELLDSAGCYPFTAEFMVNTDIGAEFIWDFECDGENDSTVMDSIANFEYPAPGIYDLCVTVISDSGCINNAFDSAAIEVFPVPNADFLLVPPVTSTIDPNVSMTNLSVGDSIWKWDLNGDGIYDDTITHDPEYEYENPGEYQVTLYIVNEYGCSDVHMEIVTISEDQAIYVPNTFTPDGDGFNDFFFAEVTNIDPEDYELLIFNRWGEFIWGGYALESKWDGTTYGVESQQDTYIWRIRYKDLDGNTIELMGHVNLLR